MNQKDYRTAMDALTPDSALKQRIAGKVVRGPAYGRFRTVRRGMTGALAAVLMLACLTTAALAISPELRMAVFTLLHIQEAEKFPAYDSLEDSGIQTTIGEQVQVEYVQGYRLNLGSLLYADEYDEAYCARLPTGFWTLEDGTLVPQNVELRESTFEIQLQGVTCQGTVFWLVWDDTVYCFDARGNSWLHTRYDWYTTTIPGRTDAVCLHMSVRTTSVTESVFLYHLDTGEIEDVVAGIGTDLPWVDSLRWTRDQRYLIIRGRDTERSYVNDTANKLYVYDNQTETLTDLTEQMGRMPWVLSMDDETLILYAWSDDRCSNADFYTYELSTGEFTLTLTDQQISDPYDRTERPSGMVCLNNGPYCVRIDEKRQIWVVDMKTGQETLVEGFELTPLVEFYSNPSGTKVLYRREDSSQMGVLDLEKGTFLVFDREGFEHVDEFGYFIRWMSDDVLHINAGVETDGERENMSIFYDFT